MVGREGGAVWPLLEVEIVGLHAGDVGLVRLRVRVRVRVKVRVRVGGWGVGLGLELWVEHVVGGVGVLVAVDHLVEDMVSEQRVGGVQRCSDPRLIWVEAWSG